MKKLVLLVVLFVALSATACDSLPGMKSQPATTTPTTLPTSAPVATAGNAGVRTDQCPRADQSLGGCERAVRRCADRELV